MDYVSILENFKKLLLRDRGSRANPKPKKEKYYPKEASGSVSFEKPNPILENVRLEYIEKIMEVIPPREKLTIPVLQQYLKSCAEQAKLNDIEKAYLVYYWVTHNIDYDFKSFLNDTDKDCSPDSVLKTGNSVCAGYSSLFHDLVTYLGIECENIECFGKGFGFQVGEAVPNKTNHEHNAIKLYNKWYLVDSTWGAGSIVDNKYKRDFNNYYFCTEPEEFALTHYPNDPKWQLLPQPVTKDIFSIFPFIDKRFFQLGFNSINPFAGEVQTEQIIDVTFYYDPDLDDNLKMNCNLFFEKKEQKNCVLIQKYEDTFNIRIVLNKKGAYKAHFFAINGDWRKKENTFKQITELKINSKKDQDKPILLPKIIHCYGDLVLERPLINKLPKGSNVYFQLYSLSSKEITIVSGDDWIDVQKDKDGYFKKEVIAKGKEVQICIKREGKIFPKYIYEIC